MRPQRVQARLNRNDSVDFVAAVKRRCGVRIVHIGGYIGLAHRPQFRGGRIAALVDDRETRPRAHIPLGRCHT